MKELEQNRIDKPEMEAVVPVKKHKKKTTFALYPGHRIFELNLSTGIINEVVPEKTDAAMVPEIDIRTGKVTGTTTQVKMTITEKENCIYDTALNARNVDKKFQRRLGEKYKYKR